MKKLIVMLMMMAPVAVFAQKFGKVNTQTIMQSLPELSKVNGELEATAKQYENELKSMQEELQRQSEAYEKAKSTMNATTQQQKEQELQGLYQKIQQTYQDNQQALQKAQQEKMATIQEKVLAAVKKVGEAGGYVYIVDTSAGVIPYISTQLSTDVSDQIKKEVGIQ